MPLAHIGTAVANNTFTPFKLA